MTLQAFPFWDMTIALNHIHVAMLTLYSSLNILSMIEIPSFNINIPFGLNMTGLTPPHCTRDAFLFSSGTHPIKMTDETVGLMDSQMESLDKLGMTACTAKSHPPSQFSQMLPMREMDIFKDHFTG
jgi:hypothetical protein